MNPPPFDLGWATEVRRRCDPVLAAADVGFQSDEVRPDPSTGRVDGLLWEADPAAFVARYPDSGLEASYGAGWAEVHCVDYWVYLDHDDRRCRLSVEGWDLPELGLDLSGHGGLDGADIAAVLARILRV